MVEGKEENIEHNQCRGQEFIDRLHLCGKDVIIDRGGVIKEIVGQGQAAEEQQRLP